MQIVNDKIPETCFDCKYKEKCNIWEELFTMSDEELDDILDGKNKSYFVPFNRPYCKYICRISPKLIRFYLKWIRRKCTHLCCICRHTDKCELYQIGEEDV